MSRAGRRSVDASQTLDHGFIPSCRDGSPSIDRRSRRTHQPSTRRSGWRRAGAHVVPPNWQCLSDAVCRSAWPDDLSGPPDAIRTAWPDITVQTSLVHNGPAWSGSGCHPHRREGPVQTDLRGPDADLSIPSRPSRIVLNHPTLGGTGGSASIAARSTSTRPIGRAVMVRTTRRFAPSIHSANWVLKSHGEPKVRPGMNEVARHPATFSRNHDDDPAQPTRSTSTVAGMPGNAANSSRTRGSNGVNDVSAAGRRRYFGGSVEFTAFVTVFARDPQPLNDPRARNALRSQPPDQAQPSKVITFQVPSAHLRPAGLLDFQPSSTTPASSCSTSGMHTPSTGSTR